MCLYNILKEAPEESKYLNTYPKFQIRKKKPVKICNMDAKIK